MLFRHATVYWNWEKFSILTSRADSFFCSVIIHINTPKIQFCDTRLHVNNLVNTNPDTSASYEYRQSRSGWDIPIDLFFLQQRTRQGENSFCLKRTHSAFEYIIIFADYQGFMCTQLICNNHTAWLQKKLKCCHVKYFKASYFWTKHLPWEAESLLDIHENCSTCECWGFCFWSITLLQFSFWRAFCWNQTPFSTH